MKQTTNSLFTGSLGFIGAGRMAQALAGGLVSANAASAADICFHDPSNDAEQDFQKLLPAVTCLPSNSAVAQAASVLVLAVKPQMMPAVFSQLDNCVTSDQLVISIAGGITLRTITDKLSTQRVIRVMPNTPCLVRQGASAFAAAAGISDEDRGIVRGLLSAVGNVVEVSEPQLDAVTGLSGSGPAYVLMMIEALADGGVLMGLPRTVSQQLAMQTVYGTAALAIETGHHTAELRDQVASPAGTTIQGIRALEHAGFRAAIMAAVSAGTHRARELSRDIDS